MELTIEGVAVLGRVLAWLVSPGSAPFKAVSGRLAPGRHPIRATARARISQFAEANNTCRWFRFFARPR